MAKTPCRRARRRHWPPADLSGRYGLRSPLTRFVLAALVWLPASFVAWHFLAPIALRPVALLCQLVASTTMDGLVSGVEVHAAIVSFVTTLKAGRSDGLAVVTVDVNMLTYAIGVPVFVALVLAARQAPIWRTLGIGYATMLPFMVWGVLADFLKNVAVTAAPQITSQSGFTGPAREAIVFAYQFGALIVPVVVPAAAWILTHRRFLERLRSEARVR